MFNSDKPIKTEEEDELNRMPFIRRLSKLIRLYEPTDCLVIGLMGEWGCGKSSILNLTFKEIEKEKSDWIFIEFNPWYFTNQDNLILQFFNTLFNELNFSKKFNRKAKNTIKRFLRSINLNLNFNVFSATMNLDKLFSDEDYKKFTIFKKELYDIFLNLDIKIIISIDNIDRLNDEEVNQILTLVNNLADFPNVIYILSFDNTLILKSLSKCNIHSPEDYLKKIIQIPIIVPQVTESNLELLIHKYIEPIYNNYFTSENKFFENGFWELLIYLKPFLKNIRDLKRYVNILNFYCEEIIEDINIIDFMLLLAIQTFQNDVYHQIKNNKEFLTLIYDDQPDFHKTLNKLFNDTKDSFNNFNENDINLLMLYLFPIFSEYFGPDLFVRRGILVRKFRICESKHFDKYFTLSLEESEVSDFYIDTIIQFDKVNLSKELISLRDDDKLNSFLDKLIYKIKDMDLDTTKNLICTFFKVADEFFNEKILYNTKVNLILEKLFNKIQIEDECFEILDKSLNQNKNLFTVIEFIYGIGLDYGLYEEKNIISNTNHYINLDSYRILENKAQEKIIELKNNGELAKNNYLSIFLKYWSAISEDESEVINYVETITKDNHDLIVFLYKFRRIYHYYPHNSMEYDFDFNKIEQYFDLEELSERLKIYLQSDNISNKEREFCNYFLSKYHESIFR